ncbi:MAG TPA: heme ABC exporter ATP-binding protein CcmA [Balneolaceae bacterium]|nr:heme ABC exporter ATP-binding protein CcmA [Balneolaceae bacterium]
MIVLQAEQLAKTYNKRVIFEDLSFSHSNGILGIAGYNGSGKSTLLKCLAGLARPSNGTITWKEHDNELQKDEIRPRIGYAAPYINLYAELTALENLEFIADLNTGNTLHPELDELLEFVQMSEFKQQLFKQLSTGQQQRIKLAAALLRNPDILFLDEPGSNLDDKGHELVKSIAFQQKEEDKLVIIASNDPAEIDLCDQAIRLNS